MKKMNLGIVGASGKMGTALRESAPKQGFCLFIAESSRDCPDFVFSVESLENVEEEVLSQVDVWIDFSSPEKLIRLTRLTTKTPIVSGTTGLSKIQFDQIKRSSEKRAVFWASNMSVGIWALRKALAALKTISDFDFSVDETHHTQKKDNPSGTAKTLHEDLEGITQKKVMLPDGKRLGGVFGIHRVTAASQSELLTFEHTALNRGVFAEGALKAARWIVNRKNGYYSMDDLLK